MQPFFVDNYTILIVECDLVKQHHIITRKSHFLRSGFFDRFIYSPLSRGHVADTVSFFVHA